jgi:hypothetical protein
MRSRVSANATAIVVLAALWPAALAAGEVSVSGRVITGQGAPVPGYPVIIEGEYGQQVAITDGSGNFTARGLAVGRYEAVPANRLGEPLPFTVDDQTLESLGGGRGLTIGDITIPNQWQMQD